jgi:hypothetical protein
MILSPKVLEDDGEGTINEEGHCSMADREYGLDL